MSKCYLTAADTHRGESYFSTGNDDEGPVTFNVEGTGTVTFNVEFHKMETPTSNGDWRLPPLDIKVFCNKVFGYNLADLDGIPEPQPQDEDGQFLFEFMR